MIKGSKMSPESRAKISASLKGNKYALGFQHSEETIRKVREASLRQDHSWKIGMKASEETRKKQSEARKGKPFTKSHRENMSGENHWNWKGGITTDNEMQRKSLEYRLWRESVFQRDNWTCQECGVKGGTLHADHIKPFSQYPDLRLALDNGRTLCVGCHRKTETYAGRLNKKISN